MSRSRASLGLVAAAAAGWLVAAGLDVVTPGHPFASTLGMLVFVAVAGQLLAEYLGARFGLRLRVFALAVGAAAVAAPSLGVLGLERMVMAAVLLLLGAGVVSLLPALRRRLGHRREQLQRPDLAFLVLPLLVYLALIPWTSEQRPPDGDEPYYLLIAHSLVHDFDVDLTNNYQHGDSLSFMPRRLEPQLGDPKGRDGHWFSRHDFLFPAVATIPYALGGKNGVLMLMAALAAALGWWTLRLARHQAGSNDGLFRAWCLMVFLSPLVVYSHQVWIEVPAALLLVIALDGILAINGARPSLRASLGTLGATLLMLPLKLRLALLAGPLALLFWWRSGRSLRFGALVGIPLVLVSVGLLSFNTWFFGRALKVYELGDLGLLQPPLVRYLRHFVGVFFDLSFGLLALSPVWLVLIPALVVAWRRREPMLVYLAVVAGPYFFLLLSRREWYGGWSPAFRYGLVALPLLALILAPALDRARGAGWRLLASFGGVLTLGTLGAVLIVPGWSFNFADGSSRLADLAMARFDLDLARLLPSGIRDRAATWWVPLIAAVVVLMAARWRGAGRNRQLGAALGVGLALIVPLALVSAAARFPTRVIEVEDRWVVASDGAPHPSIWTPDRARFRGGWALPAGATLAAPIVVGGERLEVRALIRPGFNTEAPIVLELAAGEQIVAQREVEPGDDGWQAVDFGAVAWPADAPLVLGVARTDRRRLRNFVVVDRVELVWH